MHQKSDGIRISSMGEDIENVLRHIRQEDPSVGLFNAILLRIAQERVRAARIKFGIPAFVAAVSLIGSVSAAQYAISAFSQSAFMEYLSLASSDSVVVMAHWQEFLLSLAESIPFMGTTVALGLLFALLYSVRLMLRNITLASALISNKIISA